MSEVYLDPDGSLRNPSTLELIGHHFTVDDATYYIKINKNRKNVHKIKETSKS